MKEPPVEELDCRAWHRLIKSRYSESGTVLSSLVDTPEELADIASLDGATNDRLVGELTGLPGISPYELVYGIPNAHIVNAAFTHTSEFGARFHDSTRGAWYAAEFIDTAMSEVVYHFAKHLGEIIVAQELKGKPPGTTETWDDWLADFRSTFHVLRPVTDFAECLLGEPVPDCYGTSQALARDLLLNRKSNGLIYPSVRHNGAQCLVCFRPALVYSPRRSGRIQITFVATAAGYDWTVTPVPL